MKKTILLVEDTVPLRKAIKIKLSSIGYTIVEAENGQKGIDMYEGGVFDLIVTDLVMPEKNGLEFLRELKKRGNTVPVIVLSNVSRMEEQSEVADLGVGIYLVKIETTLEVLALEVRQLLE